MYHKILLFFVSMFQRALVIEMLIQSGDFVSDEKQRTHCVPCPEAFQMRMRSQIICLHIYTLRSNLRLQIRIQDRKYFVIESDLESCFYRQYVRLIYAIIMSTICSLLEQILRFDFAGFDEDSDGKEEVILLLGEVIKFLLQFPTHNFYAMVIKIKSVRKSV